MELQPSKRPEILVMFDTSQFFNGDKLLIEEQYAKIDKRLLLLVMASKSQFDNGEMSLIFAQLLNIAVILNALTNLQFFNAEMSSNPTQNSKRHAASLTFLTSHLDNAEMSFRLMQSAKR